MLNNGVVYVQKIERSESYTLLMEMGLQGGQL
jgi:hypothetical protein